MSLRPSTGKRSLALRSWPDLVLGLPRAACHLPAVMLAVLYCSRTCRLGTAETAQEPENGCLAAVVGVCMDNGADAIVYVRSRSEAQIVTDKKYSTIQTQEAPAEVMLLVLADPPLKGRLAKAVENEAARKAAREKEDMRTATELQSGGDERLQPQQASRYGHSFGRF